MLCAASKEGEFDGDVQFEKPGFTNHDYGGRSSFAGIGKAGDFCNACHVKTDSCPYIKPQPHCGWHISCDPTVDGFHEFSDSESGSGRGSGSGGGSAALQTKTKALPKLNIAGAGEALQHCFRGFGKWLMSLWRHRGAGKSFGLSDNVSHQEGVKNGDYAYIGDCTGLAGKFVDLFLGSEGGGTLSMEGTRMKGIHGEAFFLKLLPAVFDLFMCGACLLRATPHFSKNPGSALDGIMSKKKEQAIQCVLNLIANTASAWMVAGEYNKEAVAAQARKVTEENMEVIVDEFFNEDLYIDDN
jgi:hypothetical protein